MIDDKIGKAIQALDNTKEYTHIVGDIDSIVWINGSTAISKSVIEAKITEMETAEANKSDADKGKDKLKALGLSDAEISALLN
jgi:hypothetical protein|tara:strand:- start:1098 stop:1346 length:249 start_codon:yes stop_codon:yes gene_type:complete